MIHNQLRRQVFDTLFYMSLCALRSGWPSGAHAAVLPVHVDAATPEIDRCNDIPKKTDRLGRKSGFPDSGRRSSPSRCPDDPSHGPFNQKYCYSTHHSSRASFSGFAICLSIITQICVYVCGVGTYNRRTGCARSDENVPVLIYGSLFSHQ